MQHRKKSSCRGQHWRSDVQDWVKRVRDSLSMYRNLRIIKASGTLSSAWLRSQEVLDKRKLRGACFRDLMASRALLACTAQKASC